MLLVLKRSLASSVQIISRACFYCTLSRRETFYTKLALSYSHHAMSHCAFFPPMPHDAYDMKYEI